MDNQLVDYALARILDDIRIGQWATGEVDKRLNRQGPQDHEFWATYTIVTNELLDAVRKRTSRVADLPANDRTCRREWYIS